MTLSRVSGWRARFERVVDDIKRDPFDWSRQHDCALGLGARLVEAVTGEDFAAAYRGRYSTRLGAIRVMRNEGFNNLGDLVASLLPEIHPSRAKIGDLALFEDDGPFGYALGVVNGERVFVLREDGMGTMDLLSADRAFSIG